MNISGSKHKVFLIFISCLLGFYTFIELTYHSYLYCEPVRHDNAVIRLVSILMSKIGFSEKISDSFYYASVREYIFAILLILLVLYIGFSIQTGKNRIRTMMLPKNTFLICGTLIAVLSVSLQLNGTSLYQWNSFIPIKEGSIPLWGISRSIRSDEWAVWTPMAVSQEYIQYADTSTLLGDGSINTMWISIGGIPSFNSAVVFKPLYWGFLLFGSSIGMSILWVSRILLLFFLSYYCAQLYTASNKGLSLSAAMLITFAPYVQWWLSQSIAETIFFPEIMILCLNAYIKSNNRWKKLLLSIIYAWSLGCFFMIGYPAWLIPMFYLIIICSAFLIIKNRFNLHFADVYIIVIPVLATALWLFVILYKSLPTLKAVSESVYPGERLFTGKSISSNFFVGLYSLLLPFTEVPVANTCELSCFISFAPVGLILTVYRAIKEKKADVFSWILVILELLILCFLSLGLPPIIAKTTLLSQCVRLIMVYGVIDIVLLLRVLSLSTCMPPILGQVMAIIIATIQTVLLAKYVTPLKHGTLLFVYILTITTDAILLTTAKNDTSIKFISFCLCIIAFIAGGFVNPIQRGIETVTESPFVISLKSVEDTDESNYLVEGSFPEPNLLLFAGKRVINSTQVYPNVDRWKEIDPEGKYQNIYNRFCHISLELTTEETEFSLLSTDHVKLSLSISDLDKLEVNYLVTAKEYSKERFPLFNLIGREGKWNIYKIC